MKRCLALMFAGMLLAGGLGMSEAADLKVGYPAPAF